jgi:hypothetical protein
VKWRLLDDAPILGDFAILPSIKAPTGSIARGTGTNTTDASFLLISSHDLNGIAMDLNAGITRRSGQWGGRSSHGDGVDRVVRRGLAGNVGWVAELFGYPGTGGPAGQKGTAAFRRADASAREVAGARHRHHHPADGAAAARRLSRRRLQRRGPLVIRRFETTRRFGSLWCPTNSASKMQALFAY